LSITSPVFAPGVESYVSMGAVDSVWRGDLAAALVAAINDESDRTHDTRADLGRERGGRRLASDVAARMLAEEDSDGAR
jgi:malonate decarboxylase gamma subunit